MEFKLYNGELNVIINDNDEIKQKVFDRIVKYIKDNNCVSGEHLQQSDECLLDAPDTLTEIIDNIIKPKTEWEG